MTSTPLRLSGRAGYRAGYGSPPSPAYSPKEDTSPPGRMADFSGEALTAEENVVQAVALEWMGITPDDPQVAGRAKMLYMRDEPSFLMIDIFPSNEEWAQEKDDSTDRSGGSRDGSNRGPGGILSTASSGISSAGGIKKYSFFGNVGDLSGPAAEQKIRGLLGAFEARGVQAWANVSLEYSVKHHEDGTTTQMRDWRRLQHSQDEGGWFPPCD